MAKRDWVAVTPSPLSANELASWATRAPCGAVVTFCGTVRSSSGEHDDVTALEYETDVKLAESALAAIVAETRRRWPTVEAVAVHHRIGRVDLCDVAVVVAVSSPHRRDAFDAAQYCIDTLKDCVPMWKREIWPGGGEWSGEAHPLRQISDAATGEYGRDAVTGSTS